MKSMRQRTRLEGAKRSFLGLAAASALLPTGCTRPERDTPSSAPSIASLYTPLRGASCREEIDADDPNGTTYLACPGVAGYSLIVRRAEAGRRSVDVVDGEQRVFPLDVQAFVTPHMSTLRDSAQWRVATVAGRPQPIALIVPVEAREDVDDPETVTRVYLAVAKIAPNAVCVVDRVVEGERSAADARVIADSARARPCAPPLSR